MELNRLFDQVEKLLDSASWRSVFGEPYKEGDVTIIPLARLKYGFGAGFGSGGPTQDESEPGASGEGVGYGGGILADPAGVVRIQGDRVVVEPYLNVGRLGLAGILFAAWAIFWITWSIRQVAKGGTGQPGN